MFSKSVGQENGDRSSRTSLPHFSQVSRPIRNGLMSRRMSACTSSLSSWQTVDERKFSRVSHLSHLLPLSLHQGRPHRTACFLMLRTHSSLGANRNWRPWKIFSYRRERLCSPSSASSARVAWESHKWLCSSATPFCRVQRYFLGTFRDYS